MKFTAAVVASTIAAVSAFAPGATFVRVSLNCNEMDSVRWHERLISLRRAVARVWNIL
jgi:hypothetical protein